MAPSPTSWCLVARSLARSDPRSLPGAAPVMSPVRSVGLADRAIFTIRGTIDSALGGELVENPSVAGSSPQGRALLERCAFTPTAFGIPISKIAIPVVGIHIFRAVVRPPAECVLEQPPQHPHHKHAEDQQAHVVQRATNVTQPAAHVAQ